MTKIKLCGLTRPCDIEAANELMPDYIGLVFAEQSRRYVSPDRAEQLVSLLDPKIKSVGVFVNEAPERVSDLLKRGIIDIAQLHGSEDEDYIACLKGLVDKPIIKAFRIDSEADVVAAQRSSADYIMLDSGSGGTGSAFDWNLIQSIDRRYFLAGGLHIDNVDRAIRSFHPFAVDVSSGIETDGVKDYQKMQAFVNAVRKEVTK